MTDISMLIKEAKPLYYKRKKQRQLIKNISVGVSMSLLLGVLAMNQIAPNMRNLESVIDDAVEAAA